MGAVLVLSVLALILGTLLGLASRLARTSEEPLIEAIQNTLPQTQCGQCGYPGCRPYAQAIVTGVAINRCPPGGEATIVALAELLGRDVLPLDGHLIMPGTPFQEMSGIARIDEAACIGCALCLPACPVDAIIGATRFMHTVVEVHCTGCELCIAPCPVDCIAMVAPSDAVPLEVAT